MVTSPANNTRAALRELSLRHGIHEFTPNIDNNSNSNGSNETNPSPEEQLIQQRGRRQTELALKSDTVLLTPPKNFKPAKLTSINPIRKSPRKRLNLSSDESPSEISILTPPRTPNSEKTLTQDCKRIKHLPKESHSKLNAKLKALSCHQLVNLMNDIMIKHPQITDDVKNSVPAPDISLLEDHLKYLRKNILKSIPQSRWGSKTGTFCYNRVSTHIEVFKKDCIDQAYQLVQSEHWPSVSEYILIALKYVDSLPNWDNPANNKHKEKMFKILSTHLLNCVKKIISERNSIEYLQETYTRLSKFKESSQTLNPCLNYIVQKIIN